MKQYRFLILSLIQRWKSVHIMNLASYFFQCSTFLLAPEQGVQRKEWMTEYHQRKFQGIRESEIYQQKGLVIV